MLGTHYPALICRRGAGTSASMLRSCGSMTRSCAARSRQLRQHVLKRQLRASVAAVQAKHSWKGRTTAARIRPRLHLRATTESVAATPPAAPPARQLRNASALHPPLTLWLPARSARRADSRQRADYFQRRHRRLVLPSARRQQQRDQHGRVGAEQLRLCRLQRERHQEY